MATFFMFGKYPIDTVGKMGISFTTSPAVTVEEFDKLIEGG
jgi:hypothetical protein